MDKGDMKGWKRKWKCERRERKKEGQKREEKEDEARKGNKSQRESIKIEQERGQRKAARWCHDFDVAPPTEKPEESSAALL